MFLDYVYKLKWNLSNLIVPQKCYCSRSYILTSSIILKNIDTITHAIYNQILTEFFTLSRLLFNEKHFPQEIVYIILILKSQRNNRTLLYLILKSIVGSVELFSQNFFDFFCAVSLFFHLLLSLL
ncbi:hypothetical protein HJG60_011173 [Phyllostomus discolor]|uniref:Uncharacterized protein n=1 Tax=Phyllostomus discolor TaxID=89673 RepID=A0A834E1F3_9CHIR|nr:hypothetical protein HJG60_011173 [Phyllostomus discolor]